MRIMKNFIFISPNFPTNYWKFCRELKNNGLNVLGIGDQAYDELLPELKESLTEYFKVGSMENYDEVYRAVAFSLGNTVVLIGWNLITNIGWNVMLRFVLILILQAVSITKTFHASSTNPR